jgi:hypothetical protein
MIKGFSRHLVPTVALGLVALFLLSPLLLGGAYPYDAYYEARFRPLRPLGQAFSDTTRDPGVAALAARSDPVHARFGLFWASYVGGDHVVTTWPDYTEAHRQVRAGEPPLWNSRALAGLPHYVGNSVSLFSPLSAVQYLFSPRFGRVFSLFVQWCLAALSLYIWLVSRGRSRPAAFGGALVWMLNPAFCAWLYFGDSVPCFAFLPFGFIAVDRFAKSGLTPGRIAALAAVFGLSLLPGNLQFGGLSALTLAGYGIVVARRAEHRWRIGATILASGLLGMLAASIHVWPFVELALNAVRPEHRYAATNSLPIESLLTWFYPRLFGHPGDGSYAGGFLFFRPYFTLFGPGPSALVVVLAALGAVTRKPRAAAGVAAVLGVLTALSVESLHSLISAAMPGFDSLDILRTLPIVYLALAALTAHGLETLTSPYALRVSASVLAFMFLLALGLSFYAWSGSGLFSAYLAARGPLVFLAPSVAGPILLVMGLVLLSLLARKLERHALWGVLALLAFELVVLARANFFYSKSDRGFAATSTVKTLKAAIAVYGKHRIFGGLESESFPAYDSDHLPPNSAERFGFSDLRGATRLPPRRMVELLSAAGEIDFPTIAPHTDPNLPLFDLLDVGYALSDHSMPATRWTPLGASVYRRNTLPKRAYFTRCAKIIKEPDARLAYLASPSFAPDAEVVLGSPPSFAPRCEQVGAETPVSITLDLEHRVEIALNAPALGYLVLADAYYPGWSAAVDGVETEILEANHALRAVIVPAGKHRVTMQFRPRVLATGALISALAWCLIAWLAIGKWPRQYEVFVVGALSAALFTARVALPLPNDNDALYASVVRALRASGDAVWFTIDRVPFLDKPPLFFWVEALFTSIFGESVVSLRLPVMLCGAATVMLTYRIARRVSGDSRLAGLLAAAVLATSPTFFEYASRVYMEVPVTLAVLVSFHYALSRRFIASGAVAGVGFLLKSVVGCLGFGFAVLADIVATRRLRRVHVVSGLVMIAIIVPWHALAYLRDPATFLDFTFVLHVRDQMMAAQPWSTGGPLFYVFSLAREDVVMATAFALTLVGGALSLRKERSYESLALFLAVIGQLALYSAIATKKPFYLLTAYPIAAIAAARLLAPVIARARYREMFAAFALSVVFVIEAGHLWLPDPALEESYWLAPLAERMRALSRPDERLQTLDIYFASPQFYAQRPGVYVVSDPAIVDLIGRIPYLRYGHKVVAYDDALLRKGGWMIASHTAGTQIVARLPGTTVIARNAFFVLLRGPS